MAILRRASVMPAAASLQGEADALHPLTWAAWLGAALAMVFLTSNPLYITIMGLAALLVYVSNRRREQRAMDYLLAGGVALAALTVPLNLLAGSSGATEIVALPSATLPRWLGSVTFGGDVTAESLVHAAGQAAGIATMMALVFAFNASVDHFRLLRHVPAGLAQLGIIITIGLLLIPETLTRAAALRESRALRGHRAGGGGATLAMALPLLSSALERSVQRAESLDSRGFGRLARRRGVVETLLAVAGVALAACGAFWAYYADAPALPLAAMAAGGAIVVAVVVRQGADSAAVRLPSPTMSAGDAVVVGACALALAVFAVSQALDAGGLTYMPFPEITAPSFSAIPALACLLMAAPALFPATERSGR